MTLTEEEAKKKWCPFGRIHNSQGSFNRNHLDQPMTRCLGSGCMMWRWVERDANGVFYKGRCGY